MFDGVEAGGSRRAEKATDSRRLRPASAWLGIVKVVTAVANGNLRQKLTVEAKGEVAALAETINNMTDTLATFAEQVTNVARGSGVTYESDDGIINHNFRTLIVDATGHLQMVFPTGGNLSDQIAAEIIKAAAATNQPGAKPKPMKN